MLGEEKYNNFMKKDEIVEDDEFKQIDFDTSKLSLLNSAQAGERRYSRIEIRFNKTLSKDSGIEINWGINVD